MLMLALTVINRPWSGGLFPDSTFVSIESGENGFCKYSKICRFLFIGGWFDSSMHHMKCFSAELIL
jgi:hypothetical protein